ncbi:MAG: class B sortase [Faecousia sp.]
MTNKNGKFLGPNKSSQAQNAAERSQTGPAKRSARNARPAVRILLTVLAAVFCVSAIALTVCLLHLSKARSDFRELSSMVQEAPESTAPAPETQPQEAVSPSVPEETEPTQETEPVMLEKYAALYEQNPDLFGWLRIEGTAIDYPVMHSPDDPEKYLHTNFAGEYSFGGIPFIDGACTSDSDNLIIYGHNMLDGSMFRSLMKYQEKTYWQAHPTIHFDTLYEEGEYEVLAAFYDRVYYQNETCFKFYQFIKAADEADFNNAIANFHEKQLYDTGVTAAYGDKLITLVTCAYHVENGRFVVVARRK